MTQFYAVNFPRLQQNSRLASTGNEIVLYRGESPIKEVQYELCCSACFSGHKKMVTSQLFFFKSFGIAVFWVAPLIDQFMRQVDQSV